MSRPDPMQISEAELRSMTSDLVELHHETFPQLQRELADVAAGIRDQTSTSVARAVNRRGFLLGSGAVLGGLALAACGSKSGSSSTPANSSGVPTTATSGGASGDAAGLATNASLENLAVFAYGAALTNAPKGKFGPVPPAVAGFAQHAMQQHSDHAKAWNAALVAAGKQPFTAPDPALAPTITAAFAKINNVPDLAKLALLLENTAGETYARQLGEFTSPQAISTAATIMPVERQHAAILSFILGQYPVPATFVPNTFARPNTDAGVS